MGHVLEEGSMSSGDHVQAVLVQRLVTIAVHGENLVSEFQFEALK